MEGKPYSLELFPDIEGYKIHGGTIAADILYTLERPDLVLIDRTSKIPRSPINPSPHLPILQSPDPLFP